MASRFKRGLDRADSRSTNDESQDFASVGAALAAIVAAVLGVVLLAGGAVPGGSTQIDPTPEILASLVTAERAISEIDKSLSTLCREPVLVALELEPDCETGAITLKDELFVGSGGTALRNRSKEDVGAAMTAYLEQLRRMPALWESLEAIEIRGHSDPRAFRNAYSTNLLGSQQRAMNVLLFLVGRGGLSVEDREDLQRLATVSGASFSRPPASCPEDSRECYPHWRRVEIIPVLSESLRRGDWSRTVEAVRVVARRAQERSENRDR